MTQFKSHLGITVAVLLLAFSVWVGDETRQTTPVSAQEVEKVLEIERYADQPLQLVNLSIGKQSVRDRIRLKFHDKNSKLGIDRVSFKEQDDWFKRMSITLRNASTRPVYGMRAYLYLKPPGFPMIYSLPLAGSRALRSDPLQPGAEMDLKISLGHLNQVLENLKSHNLDVSRTDITFSLDAVIFTDDLQWYRGHLVRPDPAIPDRWVPVDDPVAKNRNRPAEKPVSFLSASFKTAALVKPAAPVFATCKGFGGFQGTSCSGDPVDCISRTDFENFQPGLLSHQTVFGFCEDRRDLGLVCNTLTTHNKLLPDSNCVPCPDADGDGFYDSACGGTDCDDTKSSVKPSASENTYLKCMDGDDNDCDGLRDCDDSGCWNTFACQCEPINCEEGTTPGPYPECGCVPISPIVVDVAGNGFNLTNAATGVRFDFNQDGTPEQISWTASNSDDAWLCLDRDQNGTIDNGGELFGNLTPQSTPPPGMGRNGFNALVEYDKTAKGGNADGLITERDAVFGDLLLWQDTNHNGISETNELRTLNQLGLMAIECDYKESKKTDQYGNQFRYRAKVRDQRDMRINRWAWDVFLVRDTTNPVVANVLGLVNPRTPKEMDDWLRN